MVVHEKNTKIYIILTYTGTILSKIIKIFTRDEFAHVSISLDVNLKEIQLFIYRAGNIFDFFKLKHCAKSKFCAKWNRSKI